MVDSDRLGIETPALLIDLDVLDANVVKMAEYFSGKRSKLRAHAKTHKSPIIAHKQLKAGSRGVCCQKLGEAEVMVQSGVEDILITNEIVDPAKIERLARLNRYADVKVAVDNLEVARTISQIAKAHGMKQGVVVEVDVRNKRCGTSPGRPTADFVKQLVEMRGLNLLGIMAYEGPFLDVQDFEQRKTGATKLLQRLLETVEMVENQGTELKIISAGSTGTYNITADYPRVTEVEAGSYVFMDSTYRKLKGLGFGCSLSVLATIVSKPVPERLVVDTGWKTITSELGMPEAKDVEGARVYHLSEEHALIAVSPQNSLRVGDKIELIPSHCCTTVNLHDVYYGVRNGQVETIWPISARGKSR
jgi:D-serine deaminase-like pyridoxal phosphate-dependent protein